VTAPGDISLAAGQRMVVSSLGRIDTAGGMIDVGGASLKMIDGATMLAEIGRIAIEVTGDALVTGIRSGHAAAPSPDVDGAFGAAGAAVSIVAGGRIFAGNAEPDRVDIETTAPGAGVQLSAALGIGDKTQASERWQDGSGDLAGSANLVTDVPNPLRIRTSALDVQAGSSVFLETLTAIGSSRIVVDPGDINVRGFADFRGNLISAVNGNVTFDIEGDLTIDRLRAATFDLSAVGLLKLPDVDVAEEAILRAGSLEVNIRQNPPGPPRLS
jgi:hypothetical protein